MNTGRPTLEQIWGSEELARIREMWDRTAPAPESGLTEAERVLWGVDDYGPGCLSGVRDRVAAHYGSWDVARRRFEEAFNCPWVVHLASQGCAAHCRYDIEALPKEEWDAVMLAALDAEPEGDEAAGLAASERLRSLAVAGGWEEYLDMEDEDEE